MSEFRICVEDGRWVVHTAVKPEASSPELTFTMEPLGGGRDRIRRAVGPSLTPPVRQDDSAANPGVRWWVQGRRGDSIPVIEGPFYSEPAALAVRAELGRAFPEGFFKLHVGKAGDTLPPIAD